MSFHSIISYLFYTISVSSTVCFDLVCTCVGVFTDLGGDYSVVRESLLYKGLSSWRRLLVSDVNRPAVHPVLLTNTLQGGKNHCKLYFVGDMQRGSVGEALHRHGKALNLTRFSWEINKHMMTLTLTHTHATRTSIHSCTLTTVCKRLQIFLFLCVRELEWMSNFSSMNESFCYHGYTDMHVTQTGMQNTHTDTHAHTRTHDTWRLLLLRHLCFSAFFLVITVKNNYYM